MKIRMMLFGMLAGAIDTLILVAFVGYMVVVSGRIPARMDEPPSDAEKWVAKHALRATLRREATEECPMPADEANLMAGAKVYASNCSGCHGTPLQPKPQFASGFSPIPTLFADGATVTDDPQSSTFWKIKHGIRFTGMPSFKTMLTNKEMWQVTLFLKHMDHLPPAVADYWKSAK